MDNSHTLIVGGTTSISKQTLTFLYITGIEAHQLIMNPDQKEYL